MMEYPWMDGVLFAIMMILLIVLYRISSYTARLTPGRGEKTPPPAADLIGRMRHRHRLLIRQAGMNPDDARVGLWMTRILVAAFLASLGLWVSGYLACAVMGVIGLILPDLWLLRVRRLRKRRIRTALSYYLDLVVSLLHAGLPPEHAFVRAGREGFNEYNPLADEIALLGHEMEMGKDRGAAFMQIAERTGVTEMRAVASAVVMGLRSGMPLMDTLHAQADLLRVRHGEEAIRRLNVSSVLAMIPVFLCGIPVFLVIIYFPAAIQIYELFRNIMVR